MKTIEQVKEYLAERKKVYAFGLGQIPESAFYFMRLEAYNDILNFINSEDKNA